VIACELGGELTALDINPLICGPAGVVAVDVLAVTSGDQPGAQSAGPAPPRRACS
jgi:hypothetical protein